MLQAVAIRAYKAMGACVLGAAVTLAPVVVSARQLPDTAANPPISLAELPPQGRATYALIHEGGPFPYKRDGVVFGNRERSLPPRPRGYYREYTVETPGLGHRGARCIVIGGQPPAVYYYSDDHYDSFRRFEPPREATP